MSVIVWQSCTNRCTIETWKLNVAEIMPDKTSCGLTDEPMVTLLIGKLTGYTSKIF